MNVGLTCIETANGRFVDLLNPLPEQICIEDIAWSLSRQARYAGHTISPLIYSIGQHSLVVEGLVRRLKDKSETALRQSFYDETGFHGEVGHHVFAAGVLLYALLHDASEAYLLDIPTPLKQLPGVKEAYGPLEDKMMSVIWEALKLDPPSSTSIDIIKWADKYALTVEAYNLIPSRGANWTRLIELDLLALNDFMPPAEPAHVYSQFIERFYELRSAL